MINFSFNIGSSLIVLSAIVLLVPNVALESRFHFALSLLVMGFINFLLRPILLILRGAINPLELAFMTFIANLLFLNVASGLIDDFDLAGVSSAIFGAVIMSFAQILIDRYEANRGKLIS